MRFPVVALALAAAVLVAACGAYGDGEARDVEDALATTLRADLDEQAPFVTIRSVECAGPRADARCRIDLGVGSDVVRVDYRVAVGGDGCWAARATRAVAVGAGTQTDPVRDLALADDLRGCLR